MTAQQTHRFEYNVARHLTQAAHEYPEYSDERAEFKFGTLTVRCKATRGAILAVAAKFRRGTDRLVALDRRPSNVRAIQWRGLKVVGPYNWRRL